MKNGNEHRSSALAQSLSWIGAIALGVLAGVVTPLFTDFGSSRKLVLYLILASTIFLVIRSLEKLLFTEHQKPLPDTEVFSGPGRPKGLSGVWKRPEVLKLIEEIQETRGAAFWVLAGRSGVGKSVGIRKHLQESVAHEILENYDDFDIDDRFDKVVARLADRQGKRLLVLDHAERLVAAEISTQRRTVRAVERCLDNGIHCLVVVRDDFYFQLHFFKDLLPSPAKAHRLHGFGLGDVVGTQRKALQRFASPEYVDLLLEDLGSDGSISPLELQIAGYVLETLYHDRDQTKATIDDYISLAGRPLSNEFFERHERASPYPAVSRLVLFGLSLHTRLREPVAFDHIRAATYQDSRKVREVLDHFADPERGLVLRDQAEDSYQWAHDQLSILFREYSATKIPGELRGNITDLVERATSQKAGQHDDAPRRAASRIYDISKVQKARTIWKLVFDAFAFGMWLGVGVGCIWPDSRSNPQAWDWSFLYIPIASAQLAWAAFVMRSGREIFSRVKSGLTVMSSAVVLVGASTVIATWFLPEWWLIAIAFTGFMIGATWWVISQKNELTSWASKRLRARAVKSMGLSVTLLLLGVAFGLHIKEYSWWEAFLATMVLVCLSGVTAVYMIRVDLSPESIEEALGLIDRGSNRRTPS